MCLDRLLCRHVASEEKLFDELVFSRYVQDMYEKNTHLYPGESEYHSWHCHLAKEKNTHLTESLQLLRHDAENEQKRRIIRTTGDIVSSRHTGLAGYVLYKWDYFWGKNIAKQCIKNNRRRDILNDTSVVIQDISRS